MASSGIGIVTLGKVGSFIAKVVSANIQGILRVNVDIFGEIEIPEEAYIRERRQYDAGLILRTLEKFSSNHRCILGITNVDLCIPIFTYVFGEAQLGGRTAVVSIRRLQKTEHGESIPESLFYERVAKVALHEIGHVFSLYHCGNDECLMKFSSKLSTLDTLPLAFCDRCFFLIKRLIRASIK